MPHVLGWNVGRAHPGAVARLVRVSVAMALLALSLVFAVGQAPPALAAPGLVLDKSAPAQILVGGQASYQLSARNPAANPDAVVEYNVSFRDVLPVGMTYVPGSTAPAMAGEPTIFTAQPSGQQTLVWSNIGDLAPGSRVDLTFRAQASAIELPVGSTTTNAGDVYAHSNPRFVPRFTNAGVVIPGSYTESASDTASSSLITALEIRKSEPSAEGELLRGVHDHTTVYTIEVENNAAGVTNNVVVSDYIPAGMEFLQCGQDDNGGGTLEYPGAPSLAATPAVGANCRVPTAVATVSNPAGYPAGVYTRVDWTLGTMAPGDTVTIRYAAGIPQRANTTTFTGGTPTPGSLDQASNLNNNNGASTRELVPEGSLTNRARVEGDYTGAVTPGADPHIVATTQETVQVEDVSLQKTVSPGAFSQGGVATYTLTVRVSEYDDASAVVLTDHLPNGMCPLDNVANHTAGSPADCAPGAGFAPTGSTFDTVTQNADGSFDVVFDPIDVPHNGVATVTFKARMRGVFTGGPDAGQPTSAGDAFTNSVGLTATTTSAPGVNPPAPSGPQTVEDSSSVTIASTGPVLRKRIMPNTTPMDCATGPYVDNPTPEQVTFTEGSRVCFEVRIDFPANVSTRGAALTDFMPVGVEYEPGSSTLTANNNVTVNLNDAGGVPVWLLGDPSGSGRFVQAGGVFEARVAGIVHDPGPGPLPDLTHNLAKMRYSDGSGGVISLRDEIDVRRAAPPPISVRKGVADVNGVPAGGNPPNTDGAQVRGGDVVTFRVDVANDGSVANSNAIDLFGVEVWDVLPAGIDCADISAIGNGGVCTDPGDGGHPSFQQQATRSAIVWALPDSYVITPGQTRTLTYDMTIPADVSVTTTYTNTAAVQSYATGTNIPGNNAEHHPRENIDTTVDPAEWDVPAASDTSNVSTPSVTVAKSNTTSITETGNNATQAVVGELVQYVVQVRIPARTSVYQGVLTDPLTTGIAMESASAAFSATNTAPASAPLPGGVSGPAGSTLLSFGSVYTNSTNTTQLFEVTVVARVTTDAGNTHGVARANTASFASVDALTGAPLPTVSASSTVTVVAPNPTLTKGDDEADNIVVAGQTITYTLTARNGAGRPTLHDTWVVDCVPVGLTFGALVPGYVGTASTTGGTGSNGCATGQTRIAWNIGDLTNTARTLSYTASVDPASAGGTAYTNTATLTGGTLADGKTDPLAPDNALERTFVRTASDTMTVQGAAITKLANPPQRTIGERGNWTVTVTIPASVNFYDASVIDQLPQGVDATSVQTASVGCVYPGGAPCALPGGGAALTSASGPGTNTRIGWFLGDLTSDTQPRTVSITYSAVIRDLPAVDRGDVLTNTARLSWNTTNKANPTSAGATFDRSSGTATANVTVVEPLLAVAKSVSDPTPAPGDVFTYTVGVANAAGPNTSPAFGIRVVDTVPVGVVVDAGSISDGGVLAGSGANGGGTITWTLAGPLAPGATASLTYDAHLAPSASLSVAALVNTADITEYHSLATGGRQYDGPQASATVVPQFPRVVVAKSVANPVAYIGEPSTWTITATNGGSAEAFGVDAADTLPQNWSYDAGTATVSVAGGPATPVEPVIGSAGGRQTLTWTDLGDLAVGQAIVITYAATPTPDVVDDPGVGATVPHRNNASVGASDATGADGNAAGPYHGPPASATARIDSADVAIDKTHTGVPVAGQSFSWQVTVRNNGPDTATGPFTVVDTLPDGITTPAASGPGWSCGVAASEVTCTRANAADTLAANASFPPITVTVGVPADTPDATVLVNAAEASARTHDPVPGNNDDVDPATTDRHSDLELTKAVVGAAVPGEDLTYTLDVRNNGPSDSAGPLVVADTLPAGVSFVSADGSGWSCGPGGGQVTCTRAAGLAAGAVAPQITVVVAVPSDLQGTLVNTARVDGPETDPVEENNEDSVSTATTGAADLAIEKASSGPFVAGQDATYRFTVHNAGPSFADPVVAITDRLPAELSYVGATSVQGVWSCSAAGQDVTCQLAGRLADGANAVVDVTVHIDPDHTGNIHNEATVTSGTPDPNPDNNTDADDTENDVESDLEITKSHMGDAVAGENLSYTLAVRNLGPSASAGPIVVTDTLPTEMALVSASGAGWSCGEAAGVVTCTHAAGLGAGAAAADITLVAAVSSGAGPATLVNVASVDGPETDPNLDNNTDDDATTVVDRANISLRKVVSGDDPVDAGATTSFEITVHNDGPSDADTIVVTDTLPAQLSLVSADGPGWTCVPGAPISCSRDSIAAGTDAPPLTVVARVGSAVADGATLVNSATAATATPGDDPGDNTDQAEVQVTTAAGLAIVKSHAPGPVPAGTQVAFDLQVSNNGPSDAAGPVTVEDTLPVGLTYVGSGAPWACAPGAAGPGGQLVTCELASGLVAGADAPALTVTAQVASSVDPGTLTNIATVTSPTPDPDEDDNTDTDDVEVVGDADLSIVKTHAGSARVGDPLDFTLLVANAGPSDARQVRVRDVLPEGLRYVDASGAGWACSAAAAVVTCDLAAVLGPDEQAAPITVTVEVLPGAFPRVENTAVVDAATADRDPSNNTSSDAVVVPPLVDLEITKRHPQPLKVGRTVGYRLTVVNNGPTADPGPVRVTDVLPDGLTFVAADSSVWECENAGQSVSCVDADGMEVGERSVIVLIARVGPAAYPEVVNTASVTSDAEDANPDNNTSSDPAPVQPRVDLRIAKELVALDLDRATYRVTVANDGPNNTVEDVVVVDTVPAGLTFASASGSGWDCNAVGQAVTCRHPGVIPVGGSASFTVVASVSAPPGTSLVNTAAVTNGDTDGGRPTDSASGTVPRDDGQKGPGDGSDGDPGGGLPGTGGPAFAWLVTGLVLAAGGAGLVWWSRRRSTS